MSDPRHKHSTVRVYANARAQCIINILSYSRPICAHRVRAFIPMLSKSTSHAYMLQLAKTVDKIRHNNNYDNKTNKNECMRDILWLLFESDRCRCTTARAASRTHCERIFFQLLKSSTISPAKGAR